MDYNSLLLITADYFANAITSVSPPPTPSISPYDDGYRGVWYRANSPPQLEQVCSTHLERIVLAPHKIQKAASIPSLL
jgi:hypothetical protein